MTVVKINDPTLKSEVCNSILRKLPLWFGIESAIDDYVKDVSAMQTWVAYENEAAIGFLSINKHFAETAEIHVMGVVQEFHRQGVGAKLLEVVEKDLKNEGLKFLTVKTLSESRPNAEYEQTRKFYLKSGFTPLEEFKTLWGEANPCLLLVKNL